MDGRQRGGTGLEKKTKKNQQQYFKIKAGEWTDRHRQIVKKLSLIHI